MNKIWKPLSLGFVAAALTAGTAIAIGSWMNAVEVHAADTVVTLDNIGASLDSTANATASTTSITATGTETAYTLNYYQCKKQGSAMLMTKNASPYISNKTAMPGNIKSVEVFINSGASKSTTYNVAFATAECNTATSGIGAVNITGGNSHVFSNLDAQDNINVAGKYFCVTLGNANNGQVLKLVITCASSGSSEQSSSEEPGQSSSSSSENSSPEISSSEESSYKITYSANGGSGTMADAETTDPVSACTFVGPSNKKFSGWNTNADGSGTSYAANADVSSLTENTTLYAQWADREALSGKETLFYTFQTAKSASNTAYASNFDVEIADVTWNVPGNQNFDGYARIGGKGTGVSRYIYTTSDVNSVDLPVTKIVMDHKGISNSALKINYVQLEVGNSTFSSVDQTVTYTPSFSVSTAGSIEFLPSTNTTWADGKYYRFTINFTNTTGSNYGLDVTGIKFYYDLVSSNYATNLSVSDSAISPAKNSLVKTALSALNITAHLNGEDAAPYSNYGATITRRDGTVEDVIDSTVFKAGDKKVTITALDPLTQGGGEFSSADITTNVTFASPVTVGNKYALVASDNVFTCVVESNIGGYQSYANTPSGYAFEVEDGLYDGTVSFKILDGGNANKYISWTGTSAQLAISDTKNTLSSWVTFVDNDESIVANASNESATLRFNTTRFCAYTGDIGVNPEFLLLGTPKCDEFASRYMKMDSYDVGGKKGEQGEGNNSCQTYYPIAKAVFNGQAEEEDADYNLSEAERILIADENGLYASAYERLTEWASIVGESYNSSTHVFGANRFGTVNTSSDSPHSIAAIVAIASASVVALGALGIAIRRRKEQ